MEFKWLSRAEQFKAKRVVLSDAVKGSGSSPSTPKTKYSLVETRFLLKYTWIIILVRLRFMHSSLAIEDKLVLYSTHSDIIILIIDYSGSLVDNFLKTVL